MMVLVVEMQQRWATHVHRLDENAADASVGTSGTCWKSQVDSAKQVLRQTDIDSDDPRKVAAMAILEKRGVANRSNA